MDSILINGILPLVLLILGWIFGGRQAANTAAKTASAETRSTDADALSKEIVNVRETLAIWKEQFEMIREDRDKLQEQLNAILLQNEEIKAQNVKLITQLRHLEKMNNTLIKGQKAIKTPQ